MSAIGVPGVVVNVSVHPAAMALLDRVAAAGVKRGDAVIVDALWCLMNRLDRGGLFDKIAGEPGLTLGLTTWAHRKLTRALELIESDDLAHDDVAELIIELAL